MDQFLTKNEKLTNGSIEKIYQPTISTTQPQGTSTKERGFNFSNKPLWKYWKILNKTGEMTCHTTGIVCPSMHNISCRNSNVIYCITSTCKSCGKQYVGETLRRIKDIDQANKEKPLPKHEKSDIEVHILEFIKKSPRSLQALIIRNRVETRFIHLLCTPAPHGLNLED